MSDGIPTGRVYAQPAVTPPDRSDWTEVLAAMRTAPLHERAEFWSAIRQRIAEDITPEAPAYRGTTQPRTIKPSVVYYLRFGDRVKIGYTTNLTKRMRAIPHDEVMATEPGTKQDEHTRHQQFADLHITGEWFEYAEPLASHIAALQ